MTGPLSATGVGLSADGNGRGVTVAYVVLVICSLLAMIEGFDTQSISLAAPQMASAFGVAPAAFGPVFASSMIGSLLSVFVQGFVGNRIGRRPVVLVSFLLMGIASLLIPLERDIMVLAALRFLVGAGVGAAMPNLFSITSEFAPAERRYLFVTIVFTGMSLGGVLGGVASAAILTSLGWPALFYISGALTIVFCLVALPLLPESPSFAGSFSRRPQGSPRFDIDGPNARTPQSNTGTSVRQLFAEGRAAGTSYLWLISFASLLVSIALGNWLPTLLTKAGFTIGGAVMATVALNGGGMVGSLGLSVFVDRWGYRPMIVGYLLGAAALVAAGLLPLTGSIVSALVFLHGLSFIGAQMCLASLAAYSYPDRLRSTGIGWAIGMGRLGGITGTMLGGQLLRQGLSSGGAFLGCAAAIVALAVILALADRSRRLAD